MDDQVFLLYSFLTKGAVSYNLFVCLFVRRSVTSAITHYIRLQNLCMVAVFKVHFLSALSFVDRNILTLAIIMDLYLFYPNTFNSNRIGLKYSY